MTARQFTVSAFSDDWRGGNPAAVCVLDEWLDDDTLQAIAAQNNLSETAFIHRGDLGAASELAHSLRLRWFTPSHEVDLCGHATLATAHILYQHCGVASDAVLSFKTRSGTLKSTLEDANIVLDFPACWPKPVNSISRVWSALGPIEPLGVWAGNDYLVVYDSAQTVRGLSPEFAKLKELDRRGVIATALSDDARDDFVSRFFAPKLAVDEDPVTGSAHCQLFPFWSERLSKTRLSGWQASSRGGRVEGEVLADRVVLKGQATTFSTGQLVAPLGTVEAR